MAVNGNAVCSWGKKLGSGFFLHKILNLPYGTCNFEPKTAAGKFDRSSMPKANKPHNEIDLSTRRKSIQKALGAPTSFGG